MSYGTGRPRAVIQREIDALQAELAAAQPDTLRLNGDVGGDRTIEFAMDGENGQPRICVTRPDYQGTVHAGLQLRRSDVPAVVAWLNYHFPKTEETA